MKKLTLEQVQYILRGVCEEFRNDVRIENGEPMETTRLFMLYTQALHGAPTREHNHAGVCAALERLAQLWEYWLNDPEHLAAEWDESERKRREFLERAALPLGNN